MIIMICISIVVLWAIIVVAIISYIVATLSALENLENEKEKE